jgi:hypothetical protein
VRLFGDRVAQKRELVDRVRMAADGREIGDIASGEVDPEILVPNVLREPSTSPERPQAALDDLSTTPVGKPLVEEDIRTALRPQNAAGPVHRPRKVVVGMFALAVIVGGAVGALLRLRSTSAATAEPNDARAVEVTTVPADAPLPAYVVIGIDSEPPGAKVVVDGEDRGVAPVDIRVPRGTYALTIELQRPGYALAKRKVVPDRDRQLLEKLTKKQ